MPRLAAARFSEAHAANSELLTADWRMGDGTQLSLVANVSDKPIEGATNQARGNLIWGNQPGQLMKPWSVIWRLEER